MVYLKNVTGRFYLATGVKIKPVGKWLLVFVGTVIAGCSLK